MENSGERHNGLCRNVVSYTGDNKKVVEVMFLAIVISKCR